ncbi:hypothetical protein JR316_0009821 [Psilocybe cubensis]|uniref:SMODS and SLOG-associating 2TM effector domain-containing protein n=2 Tax=Psilocybe cubensis TaxID=181762 RepID=A0A8H7XPP2_PSICU|nr:hypothetical protein JR316_0009821 [Psilocybe cubensis]KAH9477599.1 hypothetical protein JR316_0009821 [Psilocybe cubensis]
MASERVPVPAITPVIENVPLPETAEIPQSLLDPVQQQNRDPASDPFAGSRNGSPRQYASRNHSGASSDQNHITLPPETPRIPNLERYDDEDTHLHGVPVVTRHSTQGPMIPPPVRYPSAEMRPRLARQRTGETGRVSYHPPRSMMDYMTEQKPANIAHRLAPTIEIAMQERDKFALKAKWTGYALNAAIGLQVLLGSLTTGLSAAATSGRSAAIQTTILGGLSTVVASYLARSRGTNEPEQSNAKVKDLEHFIRECRAFEMDHGHVVGNDLDHILIEKRKQLEVLLGNTSSGTEVIPNNDSNRSSKVPPV